jgi:hypothetical protein
MAIIYSYPKANSVSETDSLIISRFEEGSPTRTMNADMTALLGFIQSNIVTTVPDLDEVLTEGNESDLSAKVNGIFLLNEHIPSGGGYVSMNGDKNRVNFYDNTDTQYAYLGQDILRLINASDTFGLSIKKPTTVTASRTATFQDASGTVAYLSDIPTTNNYGLFAQTGNSTPISGTTAETTLINGGVGTLTVPANGFTIGDSFRAVFGGVLNAANNQTIRIRVKSGSVILLDSGAQPISNITNNVFSFNVDFTIRQLGAAGVASIVSLGSFHYKKTVNGVVEGFAFNIINNTTFDTTISNTLDVTVQWGSNNATNSIYSDIFILNKTY